LCINFVSLLRKFLSAVGISRLHVVRFFLDSTIIVVAYRLEWCQLLLRSLYAWAQREKILYWKYDRY